MHDSASVARLLNPLSAIRHDCSCVLHLPVSGSNGSSLAVAKHHRPAERPTPFVYICTLLSGSLRFTWHKPMMILSSDSHNTRSALPTQ